MDFFTQDDFAILEKWAGKEYNSDNETHQNAKVKLKKGPWEKTRYWCKAVAKRTGLEFKSSKIWHKQAGPGKLEFRPYAWARLFRKSAFTEEIYFTVGIAVREEIYLHYKIDRQFQSPQELSKDQLKIASNHIVDENDQYLYQEKIPLEDLQEYNWNKLIDNTIQFIQEHKSTYNNILQIVKDASKVKKFTRVCWNSNGWTEPSGKEGKSDSEQSFEGIMGFGSEEWLFSEDLNYEGYQYGFLQGVNQDNPEEDILDLDLYTIKQSNEGASCFWVASIKNLEILDLNDAKGIENELGLVDKIKNDLNKIDLRLEEEKLNSYFSGSFLNVRFKLSDVTFPSDEHHTKIDLDTKRFARYKLYNGSLWDHLKSDNNIEKTKDAYGLGEVSFRRPSTRKSTVQQSAGSYEMHRKHDEISEQLEQYLRSNKAEKENVTPESGRKDGRAIDMVRLKDRKAILYEIKTYPSIRRTIREGLGQLLEYAYWKNPYDEYDLTLVVVGMEEPSSTTEEYLSYLRSKFDLPIHYQHFDLEKNKLGERV